MILLSFEVGVSPDIGHAEKVISESATGRGPGNERFPKNPPMLLLHGDAPTDGTLLELLHDPFFDVPDQ